MAGNSTRARRNASDSQATRQPSEAVDIGGTIETGTLAEEVNETPPSSQPRDTAGEPSQHRQRNGTSPLPVRDDRFVDDDTEEDEEEQLKRTFEQLAKLQRIAAYKEKIKAMENGTTIPEGTVGDPPAIPSVVTNVLPTMVKEPTPILAHIPDYTANSVRDHQEWERTWHRLHAVSPAYYQRDANKINVAATKLKGPLADAWEREERSVEPTTITWRYFCDFLLNSIDDPHNRHYTMYRAWRKCQQRADEDLHTYYQRLETIQSELPELSEDVKRMHLLSTMRSGLRRRLVDLQRDGLSRQELLKMGASLERNAENGDSNIGVKKVNHPHAAGEPSPQVPGHAFKKFKGREGSYAPRGGRRGYQPHRGDPPPPHRGPFGERKPSTSNTSSPNNIPVRDKFRGERRPLSPTFWQSSRFILTTSF